MLHKILGAIKHNALLQLLSSRVFIQISTILQSIIIARVLGPEGKGYFTEITIYPTLVAAFSMFGLYTGIVKLSAKNNIHKRLNITKTIIKCTCAVGLLGSIVALFINEEVFKEYDNLLFAARIYSLYVIIYCINRGLSAYNNGRQNLKLFSVSSVILYPTYFIIICCLFLTDNITVTTCVIALLMANLCSCVFLYVKNEEKFDYRKAFPINRLFRYSLKFSIADFSEPLYLYFDKALLAITLSAFDLGIYTIAISSAGLISLFSNTFSIKLFSDVANRQMKNIAKYIRINILLMFFSAVILSLLFPIIIPLIYGKAYTAAIFPAIIGLITCIVQGQSYILERSVLAAGKPFLGIGAKIIGILVFATSLIAFKYLWHINVNMASICSVMTSIFYFVYINWKSKSVLKIDESIFPRMDDIKSILAHIK